MSDLWAGVTIVSGGLFVGGVLYIAWERVPAWRAASPTEFRSAFTYTLRRVDKLQPALLSVLLVSTVGFGIAAEGLAGTLAWVAAAGFLSILVGSVAVLVPLQRRLSSAAVADVERLRTLWFRGHLIRTLSALALFGVAAVAMTV